MKNDLFYQLALSFIPGIGPVQAQILLDKYGDAKTIFHVNKPTLEKTEGIGTIRAKAIRSFNDFASVEKEMRFIEKYKIQPLFLTDPKYPQRLLNCYDPPTMLFYKGNADLNALKNIAIIGTRINTEYGKQLTEKFIKELAAYNVLIASGLAFGIDAIAHRAALKEGLPTVGVLAHGLDSIYPSQHSGIAKDMLNQGGLLTEFTSNSKPDKHNFPIRNRIVAGMCDATIVMETSAKGGSMITAELANSYNRDVFAFPGKTTDLKSAGCNNLIKNNKAILLTDAKQFITAMGWEEINKPSKPTRQASLFTSLSENEKLIVDILKEKDAVHIDELSIKSNLPNSTVAAAVLNLELQDIVESRPGRLYRLL